MTDAEFATLGRSWLKAERAMEDLPKVEGCEPRLLELSRLECVAEQAVYDAREELRESPRWSKTPPPEDGIYWCRCGGSEPYLSQVWDEGRGYPCLKPLTHPHWTGCGPIEFWPVPVTSPPVPVDAS